MRELKLDASGDLAIENGNLVIIDGPEAIAQRVKTKLQTFQGEWRFDTSLGTPWLQSILGKGRPDEEVRSLLFARILAIEGVSQVTSLRLNRDRATRALGIVGSLRTDDGTEVGFDSGVPA